jgi:hypothetical protein
MSWLFFPRNKIGGMAVADYTPESIESQLAGTTSFARPTLDDDL